MGVGDMLRIYICPKCYNYRMVSRKPDAICFHCGSILERCDIEYMDYMKMSEDERNTYKDNFIKRMKLYQEKMDDVLNDNNLNYGRTLL